MIFIKTSKKEEQTNVKVYPNPVNHKLFIDLNNENTQLKIFNILGEKVHDEKVKTIATSVDVCDWRKGNYIVVLENSTELKTYKIEVA